MAEHRNHLGCPRAGAGRRHLRFPGVTLVTTSLLWVLRAGTGVQCPHLTRMALPPVVGGLSLSSSLASAEGAKWPLTQGSNTIASVTIFQDGGWGGPALPRLPGSTLCPGAASGTCALWSPASSLGLSPSGLPGVCVETLPSQVSPKCGLPRPTSKSVKPKRPSESLEELGAILSPHDPAG